jgi:dCTP deaminase
MWRSRGVLNDRDIVTALRRGDLVVTDPDESLLRPAAISLRLGPDAYALASCGPVDVLDRATHPRLVPRLPDDRGRLLLRPGEVLLVRTYERIGLCDRLAGILDGTSDYARLGVSVVLSHQVSPGFGMPAGAYLTLELVSRLPHEAYLHPGTRICNLVLLRCRRVRRSYSAMERHYSTPDWTPASLLGNSSLDAGSVRRLLNAGERAQ